MNSAVDAAIYAAQAPERQWQAQQSTIQSQITALNSIQTTTSSLSSDLQSLTDPLGALSARTVSSSDSSVVTATASAGTAAGTHTVNVAQLATAASWYSPVLANGGASLGSSSLTITTANGGQTTFGLSTSSNATLSALVASINQAGLGVNASIVQDASGVRLALVGSATGSSAGFTVSDNGGAAADWSSAVVPSASATLPASTLQIGDGDTTANLTVTAGATIVQLANQINGLGLNLSASVITDSAGAHLSVASTSGQQVTFSADPTLVLTQASQAQNAQLTVDGVPVSSASNTVSGALNGITLNISSVSSGSSAATLSVSADTDQISAAVGQFVQDYNSTISLLSSQFTFNSSTGSQGVLGSDSLVRTLQSTLLGGIGFSNPAGGTTNSISSLADLGITMQNDGTLSLDTTALAKAVASDPQEVQSFFQGTGGAGFAGAMSSQLQTFAAPSSGSLAQDISQLTQQYNSLQSNVNDFESGYIASQRTLLTSMYSKAEIALQSLPNTLKQIQAELNNNSGD